MPRRVRFPLAVLVLIGCGASPTLTVTPPPAPPPTPVVQPPPPIARSPHERFAAFSAAFLRGFLMRFPTEATTLGNHESDAKWPDVSANGDADILRFLDATKADLAKFSLAELDPEDRTDATILANELDARRFWIVEQRVADTTPMYYSALLGEGLDSLLGREFAPLDVRLASLDGRLRGIPAVVAVAKARLAHAVRVNTETAMKQTQGLIGLCESDVPAAIAKVPAQAASLEQARALALAALKDFAAFLHDDLLPRSDGSFRAGPAAFAKILQLLFDDPEVDAAALANDARAAMVETRAKMLATALELWPSLMRTRLPRPATEAARRAVIRAVLGKLAEDHSNDASIVNDAKGALAEATAFVSGHDLMRLPDETLNVIEMPEFRRGFSTAYCDSTGPLETKPETIVAISPPPAGWPSERRASQYREYNRSMLKDLLVHEAMPGHYLQAMHANGFRSDVRAVFANGAFQEGWAVYGEWLMAERGFGGPKVRMEQLKMLLRTETNAVLDHEIHAGSMDEAQALVLMRDDAFQEEGEAVGKWQRARLSRGQLSTYFYGYRELMKLRVRAETAPGFRERTYNDRLLAFGSPPLRVIRDRMSTTP